MILNPMTTKIAAALIVLMVFPAIVFSETPRSDRWSKSMATFASQDEKQTRSPGGVVFVGSSSIRLWDLEKSFPDLNPTPINRGFGGSELEDSIRHIELLVLKHKPRMVVVYAGDNDIASGKSPDRVANDFAKLVELIHQSLPKTSIAFIAIKPSISRLQLADQMRDANKRIAKQCAENEQLQFVDIWKPMLGSNGQPRGELFQKDGLHLNDRGYELWTSLVSPSVQQKETQASD